MSENNKFSIKVPQLTLEQQAQRLRAWLTNHTPQAKTLVFAYLTQPATVTNVVVRMNEVGEMIERSNAYKYVKQLCSLNALSFITSEAAVNSPSNSPMIYAIRQKHEMFIHNIPEQFKPRFRVVYYYFMTSLGETCIPWVCKQLGYEVTEKGPIKDNKNAK